VITIIKRAFALKVREGKYGLYKLAHDNLWPELAHQLNESKINMVIYYLEPFLFVFETELSEDFRIKTPNTDLTTRWNQYMSEFLETNSDGTIKVYEVDETFKWGIYA